MKSINRTLERLRDHLGMDIAYISEFNGDDMIIRAICAPDFPDALPDPFVLPRHTSFCHHLVSGNIPAIVSDSGKHPVTKDLPVRRDFGIESYIGLPLERADGSNYGTLCCLSHQTNDTLNARDLQTVKLFSELVVEQIDHELEDERQTAERYRRIQSVYDQQLLRVKLQPIVRLSDGSLKGFEALARFDNDPYRTPDKWFAEATQIGRGIELEVEAVRKALEHRSSLAGDVTIGLNVSPACMVSEDLSDVLFAHGAERIILELTEHTHVPDYNALIRHVQRYKGAGFQIAVDDAGAGYSSLTHIVQLQPDIIKLDMSLTRNVHVDHVRRSLANAMVFFAGETQAKIVAEGIETEGERDTLSDLGVDFGQGFFFGRALEPKDAVAWADNNNAVASAAFGGMALGG